MHRFVLAEFNTHRVFSRNSASSRAIPLARQLSRVGEDPAFPVVWPSEQKGMQGGEEIEYPESGRGVWRSASHAAQLHAGGLGEMHVHKSIANRLLEPFMWHTVVVSATAWENFFGQRCSPLAQPEIRVAAEAMRAAYNASQPRVVGANDWHTPYVDNTDLAAIAEEVDENSILPTAVQVSAARCARVSYLTQAGKRDFREDLVLYDRLVSADPMHASPLEHVCRPEVGNVHTVDVDAGDGIGTLVLPRYGNLLGWHQHRFDVEMKQAFA
jgi:hypothetical protein